MHTLGVEQLSRCSSQSIGMETTHGEPMRLRDTPRAREALARSVVFWRESSYSARSAMNGRAELSRWLNIALALTVLALREEVAPNGVKAHPAVQPSQLLPDLRQYRFATK